MEMLLSSDLWIIFHCCRPNVMLPSLPLARNSPPRFYSKTSFSLSFIYGEPGVLCAVYFSTHCDNICLSSYCKDNTQSWRSITLKQTSREGKLQWVLLEAQFLPLRWFYLVLLFLLFYPGFSSCILKRVGNVHGAQMELVGEAGALAIVTEGNCLVEGSRGKIP